ncbi:SRPBCC family protein [Acinetobacter sp. WZC-1]|uniref:SRPBCC family protein n=1 Tax=Acinetobacter sp. WZC-1 TaxID=3459034 RepID=UPI00403DDD2B
MTNTVKLHRVFSAPPERVYKAFLDPDALVKWMAPHGFTAKVHHLEAREGGSYKMSFSNFSTGSTHSFGGEYIELIPGRLIRYTDQFEDPNLPGQIQMTIELKPVLVGTEVHITQSGLPEVIPVEACYLGWQESLQLLALLVNPEIPDQ